MKQLATTFLFFISTICTLFAAQVDTVEVFSAAMNKKIKVVVISPQNPIKIHTPTLYLLHGYSGNYSNWVNKVPQIKSLVDQYDYTVVCPDGGYSSWYWDIAGNKDWQYETFISKELVQFVEQEYDVCKSKASRAITGLSMGGHGALYIAIKHQDVYGAAGSTSGGVDIRPFPNSWEIISKLGKYSTHKEVWDSHTVIENLHRIEKDSLKLIVDCGTEDFFYTVNNALHDKLTYLNIPHSYLTMPGKHNWEYWSQSILYQMAFFDQFFRQQ